MWRSNTYIFKMSGSNLLKEIFLINKVQEYAGLSSLFVSKNGKKYKITCSHRLHALISSIYLILVMCITYIIISNYSKFIQIIAKKSFCLNLTTTIFKFVGYISCYFIYYSSFVDSKLLLNVYKKLEEIEYEFGKHGITSTYNTQYILIYNVVISKIVLFTSGYFFHNWEMFSKINDKYYQVTTACNFLITYCNLLALISEANILYLIISIGQKLNLIVMYIDQHLSHISSNGKILLLLFVKINY